MIRSLLLSIPLLLLLGSPVRGGEPAADSGFQISTSTMHIPERGEVLSHVLRLGTNRLSFLVPPGWQLRRVEQKKELLLAPRDQSATIRLRFVPEPPGSRESLQAKIPGQFERATMTHEFTAYAAGNALVAFDFDHIPKHRIKVSHRMAFFPFAGGTLEATLIAPAARFSEFHPAFGNLLASFRQD